MKMYCHRCARELESNAFGRMAACPGCEADTRCCRNCEFHEPTYRTECRETQAEPVHDAQSSNPCEYFRPRKYAAPPRPGAMKATTADKNAFEKLFKKSPKGRA